MRTRVLILALLLPAFSGCLIEVMDSGEGEPVSPEPFPSGEPNPGIAPGEPNPNAPREGFRDLREGEWCYYDDDAFDGRVFADQEALDRTWHDFIDCYPTADVAALPKIDWEREFVLALIAPPSGCAGAVLNVTHASHADGKYLVQYDHDENQGDACAARMSRPIVFIEMDREYGDKLDVDFVEVEQS